MTHAEATVRTPSQASAIARNPWGASTAMLRRAAEVLSADGPTNAQALAGIRRELSTR